jgi:hypothetical protein
VIAADITYYYPGAGQTEHLLDHRIMVARPVPAHFEAPQIDNVADQIELLAGVVAKKVQKALRLTAAGAEMDVR